MRIAIIGQQDFGKATMEAFLARGDEVAAVFCAPEKGRPDPLRLAAEARGVPVHQFPKLTDPAAQEAMRAARVQVGVMAYVTQFVPQDFCTIPTFGTIQFHPSLLPLHRGASSMSWAIICGRRETGFSIFRPNDGLDEGPVILTRAVPIEDEDTALALLEDDEYLASATSLEAAFLAHELQAQLKTRFGPAWWTSKQAGDYLRPLWAHGNVLNARELAQAAGAKELAPDSLLLRLTSALKLPIAVTVPGE